MLIHTSDDLTTRKIPLSQDNTHKPSRADAAKARFRPDTRDTPFSYSAVVCFGFLFLLFSAYAMRLAIPCLAFCVCFFILIMFCFSCVA
ncbi:hypothetical protein BDW69DRAFT_86147 [Aspergillus filifer]